MPTYEWLEPFWRDWEQLTAVQQRQFRRAVAKVVEDLKAKQGFRAGLRVKGVQGAEGVFEITWAPDGRATFHFGPPVHEGEVHIVWRRIGTHDVFERP